VKKTTLALLASALLALTVPAGALAAHHRHHTAAGHRAHHSAHSHRARVIRIGTGNGGAVATQAPEGAGTGTPAGTVKSFNRGILKITLTGGRVLTGKVTPRTAVGCASATGSEGESTPGVSEGTAGASGVSEEEVDEEEPVEEDTEVEQTPACSTGSLFPGAPVTSALLIVGRRSSTWTRVELGF
jgi:hypothetical protein